VDPWEGNVGYGLFAPATIPPPILAMLQETFAAVLAEPDVVSRLAANGMTAHSSTSAYVNELLGQESRRIEPIIRRIGLGKTN
jgi:tripartite-type tricarboxylate transporter receptor subunit TctC